MEWQVFCRIEHIECFAAGQRHVLDRLGSHGEKVLLEERFSKHDHLQQNGDASRKQASGGAGEEAAIPHRHRKQQVLAGLRM